MITLSIVSHSQATLVLALLEDLARLDPPAVVAIVITHNVPEIAPAWPASLAARIVTIHNPVPKGFGANHNTAFQQCRTPYFTVLNPDIHLLDDPFEPLLALFAAESCSSSTSPPLGIAAPYIVTSDGTPEDSARMLMTPINVARRRLSRTDRTPAVKPHWLAGMFLLVSSAAFEAVGGFDERFFMYCEDFDLCARFRLDGWRFVVAEPVVVVHTAQRASHRSRRHLYWHLSSLLRMWTSATFWRYRRLVRCERHSSFGRSLLPRE